MVTDNGEPRGAGDAVVTYFQPFYNLRTGRLQGLEALARRERTDRSDDERLHAGFLAEAQERGRLREVDLQVLDEALGRFAHLHVPTDGDGDAPRLIVRVNVSRDTIAHPYLVADVTGALERHGVAPDRLLVDIPTGLFRDLHAEDAALDRLRRLQDLEISFCLDGFTAKDLDLLPAAAAVPVDIITLHPSVLAGEDGPLTDLARAVQDEGLPVVAAGVETPEQLTTVQDLGFEWAQGFLLGKPAPAGATLSHPVFLPEA
ncbi:EAL domain-containing protein [Mobilicoccus pelagius]|uniref:EAL domain-containing protein n=1 Tax=Mobilicoccus pelagius NBRC 104925 TaxID=1089455 RepID=H5UR42_9MICO|nr:EAL domain-containing protein [Mobilicoccus pelagius]GAB48200.1 hypothetical protein MOPEL_067_00490 [Mobilicoccus pelagius NBRC 104925]